MTGQIDCLEQRHGGSSEQFGALVYRSMEAVVADEAGKVGGAGL